EAATGRGTIFVLSHVAREWGVDPAASTAAIQGLGNVGSYAARFFHELGGKVVAVSDISGGRHDPAGLDVPALLAHLARHRTIEGFGQGRPISNQELLTVPCDFLIPAALGGVINRKNADRVRARFVVEGANAPTTP